MGFTARLVLFGVRPMLYVSLTTTRRRLPLCRLALLSLTHQSLRPDRIIVWVSRDAYLSDDGILTDTTLSNAFGDIHALHELIEFRWTKNVGPYRKLLPMLREMNENDLVVTADDDIFYGREWLKKLVEAFDSTTGEAVACRVREIVFNPLGRKCSYLQWPIIKQDRTVSCDNHIVTFGGGAVLRRSMFDESDLMNHDYVEVAPKADDLWMSRLLKNKNVSLKIATPALYELNFVVHSDGLENDNYPKIAGVLGRIKHHLLDKCIGYMGGAICENDRAYRRIEMYFSSRLVCHIAKSSA